MWNYFLAFFTHYQVYLCLALAYLLGSLPTSYLVGRIFFNQDIRQSGSGNTGATNTLRTFGTKAGLLVLLVDILKGVAAIILARYFAKGMSSLSQINLLVSLSGLAVIFGHVFSLFLRFKGGKGVATAGGVFLMLAPLSLLFCLVFFIFTVYSTKYVSLGSVLAALAFLVIELVSQIIMRFPNLPQLLLILIVVLMIILRHKANLKRLLDGTEHKFSFGKGTQI
jgi:acyl phosphate:glycerol-3-phosphate acyltransferase